jgi:hypothetical protein
MVLGIPSSVIEPLVLRRGAPNRTPATIRLARNCGVTRVVSANDEKSPTAGPNRTTGNKHTCQRAEGHASALEQHPEKMAPQRHPIKSLHSINF